MTQFLFDKLRALRTATGRERAVLLSILTSIGNRAVGVITQLIAFPIAVHALGVKTFGVYLMLSSILAWLTISSIGIGPALTRAVLLADAAEDRKGESEAFGTAMWLALGISGALFCAFLFVLLTGIIRPEQVLGIPKAGPDEFSALIVSFVLVVVTVVTSVTEGARGGYLEQYKTNVYSGVGSILSIISLLIVGWKFPTLTAMCLAVFGASAVARVANTVVLIGHERPHLSLRLSQFRKSLVKGLSESSIAFTMGQFGSLMINQTPTLIVGWILGAAWAAPIGVLVNVELTLAAVITMITAPLWPAITNAHTQSDYRWIKRAQYRLLAFTIIYSGAVGIVIACFGNTLISVWLGGKVHIDLTLQITMGVYFPIWMLTHCYHMLLIGLGRLWSAAGCLYVFAIVTGVFGVMLVPGQGGSGMSEALCFGAGVSLPIYWWCTRVSMRAPTPIAAR